MIRSALAVALLLASGVAAAGIAGDAAGCAQPGQPCTLRLRFSPDAVTQGGPVSLFVGIVQTVNGQPNPAVAGWFDGRTWAVGMPKAAWSGQVAAPRTANIAVPGGVCGLVRQAGGPAGTYTVYAGWGSKAAQQLEGVNVAEIQAAMRSASPEVAARYAQLLNDYRAAQAQMARYADTDAVAFTNMRTTGSFWGIQSFNCGG